MSYTLEKLLADAWDACNTGPVDVEELSKRIDRAQRLLPKKILQMKIPEDTDAVPKG